MNNSRYTSDFRRFEALIPPSQNDKTRDVVHLGNVWVLPQYIFKDAGKITLVTEMELI